MRGKILLWSLLISMSFLIFVSACNGGNEIPELSDEEQLEALVWKQYEFSNERNWRGFYQTISPKIRKDCPYKVFVENVEQFEEELELREEVSPEPEITEIEVEGKEAKVYAIFTIDSDRLVSYRKYEKIGPRWYDMLEGAVYDTFGGEVEEKPITMFEDYCE